MKFLITFSHFAHVIRFNSPNISKNRERILSSLYALMKANIKS